MKEQNQTQTNGLHESVKGYMGVSGKGRGHERTCTRAVSEPACGSVTV